MPGESPKEIMLEAFTSALTHLDPARVIEKQTSRLKELKSERKIVVLGAGKASYGMYEGFRKGYSGKIEKAAVIIPEDQKVGNISDGLEILRGSHPYPTKLSLHSSKRIIDLIKDTGDLPVAFLISGGASSLFEIPVPGLSIEELSKITKLVMVNGADIYQLNAVRQSLSEVKGGKLIKFLRGRRLYLFIISDVPGDRPDIIASGPLCHSSTTENQVKRVLSRFLKRSDLPVERILKLADCHFPEKNDFSKVKCRIVLKNEHFVKHIAAVVRKHGYNVLSLGSGITGDVSVVAKNLDHLARSFHNIYHQDFFLAGGGETTVDVHGNGRGGRNQELVLRLLTQKNCIIDTFMSAGTDGIDGNSEYAGAISSKEELKRIGRQEMDRALKDNDSSSLLEKYDMVIRTGPTGNNVSDVFVAFVRGGTEWVA